MTVNIPRPLCRVCNRPVERFSMSANRLVSSITFVAICHGMREHHTLPEAFFLENKVIDRGHAFPATIGAVDNIVPMR